MDFKKINIKLLIEGKKTYPSWSTKERHNLYAKEEYPYTTIYYYTKSNKIISKSFPSDVILTPKLLYVFGILIGECPTSLGDSNYRRVTITNSNPKLIQIVLEELEKANLLKISYIIDKSIHLLHFKKDDNVVIDYWAKELNLSTGKFKCFNDKSKTTDYGVCHVYISNVLLRRVIDLIQEYILNY
ncbi:hypothetical protein HY636_01430 [Candidatus Woesearchaeota archaeon]|nr:hypothetical protein [Candidatus Woesearchaeota archaeon]